MKFQIFYKCYQNVQLLTHLHPLTLWWRRPLSCRNQSIDLRSKSVDWFLYDNGLVMKGLMFMHKVSYEFHKNLIWFLTNGLQVNDEYWKIFGIHLKFIYLVKLRSNRQATLSLENLKSKNNFEAWGLTLVLIKDQCFLLSLRIVSKFRVKSKRAILLAFAEISRRFEAFSDHSEHILSISRMFSLPSFSMYLKQWSRDLRSFLSSVKPSVLCI